MAARHPMPFGAEMREDGVRFRPVGARWSRGTRRDESERVLAPLARPDAHRIVQGAREDLAVAAVPGVGLLADGAHDLVREPIRHDDLWTFFAYRIPSSSSASGALRARCLPNPRTSNTVMPGRSAICCRADTIADSRNG
jgi:hypothetical protein